MKMEQKAKRGLSKMAAPLAVFGLGILINSAADGPLVGTAIAQPQPKHLHDPINKFSVIAQEWHRYPGLAVADIIFNNENNYGVRHPVVSCDFLDPNGKVIARRASTIFQSFPPASTIKIDGVQFSLREKDATPGSCRVLSVRTLAGPN